MLKKWIFALILFCSIGLLGCEQQSSTDLDTIVTPQQPAKAEAQEETETELEKEPGAEPAPVPAVINIIDPTSNEIIHSLSTE